MQVDVNFLSVALATVASMVIGSVWYAKPVFGKMWAGLVGLSDEQMQKGGMKAIGIAVVMSFLTAYVLYFIIATGKSFYGVSDMNAALQGAFFAWLGISTTAMITHAAFEQRPWKLTMLNVGSQFVTLMVMGAIIGAIGL